MLGYYENFPKNIHYIESYAFTIFSKKIQQKLVEVIREINCNTYTFEEIGHPTIPNCVINFEFGVADSGDFTFLNQQEADRLQETIIQETRKVIDWFCAIRYYKNGESRRPLKFDYYMLRFAFEKNSLQFVVFHERGPRYFSPEDLISFISRKVNETQKKTLLKREKV